MLDQIIKFYKSHEQLALQGARIDWRQVSQDIIGDLQKHIDAEAQKASQMPEQPTVISENGPESA
jgi:hypothetical protein